MRKKWQVRYFVVTTHYLKYFADAQKADLKAALDLHDLSSAGVGEGEGANILTLVVDGQSVMLQAPTAKEATKWVDALKGFVAQESVPEGDEGAAEEEEEGGAAVEGKKGEAGKEEEKKKGEEEAAPAAEEAAAPAAE